MIQPNSKTVIFFNPFKEDFTHAWGKEDITIKSGERKLMPLWLAQHMQKHLVDRELNALGLPIDFRLNNPNDSRSKFSRPLLESKCIIDDNESKAETSLLQELDILNREMPKNSQASNSISKKEDEADMSQPWCDSCDSKGMKHKKDCPKYKLKDKEEFAGLKQMS